ncbi:MAG: hypothetical protein ABJF88_09535 [Rhodothermales bacterium]
MRRLRLLPLLAALLLAPAALAQSDYGQTEFANSGAAEAQTPFLRGLLMLHSFEYEDAREAFQEARRIDPDFAMAAWGEALTHNHPIWQEQDAGAARAALAELAETPEGRLAKAPTERERAYLRTLDVLFGEGSKEDRDFAYADALADLSAAYPDDLDAAAFYALSILGTAHEGRDFGIYMDAAAVAEEVFAANPEHPGAAHYLIHAYDDPIHAPLGLRPARVYDDLAPAASHALHMPSHIYFALGMWDEGAEMNERSYAAAAARAERRGEPLNGHGRHALHWLHYAYLQQGRYDDAAALIDRVDAMAATDETQRFAHLPVSLRAHYVVETGGQRVAVESGTMDHHSSSVLVGFTEGLAAYYRGDGVALQHALATVQAALAAEDTANRRTDPLRILGLELEALVALDNGDADAARALLDEATDLEDTMPIDFGPPNPAKPSHELYGEVLLDLGEPADARYHFEETLARYPRRSRALLGLARAAMQSGDEATAAAVYAGLADIWHDADADALALPEVQKHAAMDTP